VGDEYEVYGTPKGLGAIYCPRYLLTAPATGNTSANPQYVLALYEADEDNKSVFRVSSSGDAYSDITPYDLDSNPGLATGIRCVTGAWLDSLMIAGLFSFDGDIRLCVTIDGGDSWVLSSILPADSSNITMQIGDRTKSLIGFTADGKVKLCRKSRLPTLTITDRIFDLDAPIGALSVFG
jgi:hypothetical protein